MATYSRANEQTLWVAAETTYDTYPGSETVDSFVAGDHVRVTGVKVSAAQEFMPITDEKDNSSTIHATTAKRIGGSFEVEGYFRHAGTSSGAPHQHLFLLNAFGSTSAGGTQRQYNPTMSNVASIALMVGDKDNNNQVQIGTGAIVKSLKLSFGADDLIKYTAAGDLAKVVVTGRTTLPGGASAGATSLTLGDASVCMTGSILAVGSLGGEQLKIATVNVSTNVITCTRGWGASTAGAISSGATLIPWHPSSATAPSTTPIAGVLGALTVGGATFTVKSGEFELTVPRRLTNDHYGTNRADGVVASGKRAAITRCNMRIERAMIDEIIDMGRHKQQKAVLLTIGATAGTDKWTVNLPTAELVTMPEFDLSGEEEVNVALEFRGVHATANSEVQMKQL